MARVADGQMTLRKTVRTMPPRRLTDKINNNTPAHARIGAYQAAPRDWLRGSADSAGSYAYRGRRLGWVA
jgi:hypothetical protein